MTSAVDSFASISLMRPFDETLLLARGVVLGVLGQVAVAARLGDRLDDARAVLALQPLELVAQRLGAAQRSSECVS